MANGDISIARRQWRHSPLTKLSTYSLVLEPFPKTGQVMGKIYDFCRTLGDFSGKLEYNTGAIRRSLYTLLTEAFPKLQFVGKLP
jgi:hypothetical protein